MSQTLKLGGKLQAGYNNNAGCCKEFIKALEHNEDYLKTMIESQKTKADDWREYVKWCVEGIFEFIRKTEFPSIPSRLNCSYYFDSLEHFKVLYESGWAQESEEERAKIRLYEVELEDGNPIKCDMLLFDEAYDVMLETQDIEVVVDCARRYFAGQDSAKPIWEIVSDKPAKAVKDISDYLRSIKQPEEISRPQFA